MADTVTVIHVPPEVSIPMGLGERVQRQHTRLISTSSCSISWVCRRQTGLTGTMNRNQVVTVQVEAAARDVEIRICPTLQSARD